MKWTPENEKMLVSAMNAMTAGQAAYIARIDELEVERGIAQQLNNEAIANAHSVVDSLLDLEYTSKQIQNVLEKNGFAGAVQTVLHWVTQWNARNGKTGASGGGGPAPSETKAGAEAGAEEAKADTEPEPTPKGQQTLRAKAINKIGYVFAKAFTARIGQLEKGEEIGFTKGELILTTDQQTVLSEAGQTVSKALSRETAIATFAKALEGLCETETETETEPETEPKPEPEPETEPKPEPETVDGHVREELEKIDKYLKGNSNKRETKPRKKAGAKK